MECTSEELGYSVLETLSLRNRMLGAFLYRDMDGSEIRFFCDPWLKGRHLQHGLSCFNTGLLSQDDLLLGNFIENGKWVLNQAPRQLLHGNLESDPAN